MTTHPSSTSPSEARQERQLAVVIDALRDLPHREHATVFELDAANAGLVAHTGRGLATGELRSPLAQGLAGACARSWRIPRVDDVARDPRIRAAADAASGFVAQRAMASPRLDDGGERIGVAQVLVHAERS
jgi:hypothetical protein